MPLIKFASPIDEPKKTFNCKYIGSTNVNKPNGMDELNNAIDKLYTSTYKAYLEDNSQEYDNNFNEATDDLNEILLNKDTTIDLVKTKWQNVAVTISPSTIYTHKINDDVSFTDHFT